LPGLFGETRDIILARYRAATVGALVAADFLTTKELEVLQALVLFLFTDPESELTYSLTGAAIRIVQKIHLPRESNGHKISFFEKEMRIRLWWQLRSLESRSRAFLIPGMNLLAPSEFSDIRLPLNVNDTDLHPDMVESPIKHSGPTEMLCVLVKLEFLNWARSSPKAAKLIDDVVQGPSRGNISMQSEDEAMNEVEAIYREKYLRNWDKNIPLHSLTHAIAIFAVSRLRFKVRFLRVRAAVSSGDNNIIRDESDMLLNSALIAMEMMDVSIHSKLSSHLFIHMTFTFQIDIYIYVISDLRRRCSGERVDLAWRLVKDFYNEHPELIAEAENTFFVALGDLTLEAWEARRKEMACGQDALECNTTPEFILLLWEKREKSNEERTQMPTISDPYDFNALVLTDESDPDWQYWNDILQI
jgi:hypothetical protein